MTKDIIHFSHANGIPAKSYSVLMDALNKHYQVGYIPMLAHNPDFPVADNWSTLADELIDYLQKNYSKPVIAVGHSFGGVLSYIAAKRRPDLIKQVVLLDAPILERKVSQIVRLAKLFNFIDKITPAGRTLGRQEIWPDKAQAYSYFKKKSLFSKTDPRCLQDYVTHGTQPCDEGVRLSFKPAIEIKIFRTVPHNLYGKKANISVPGAMIYGQQSNVVRPFLVKYMRNKMGLLTQRFTGTHLFPLEVPELTAEKIHQTIQALNSWQAPKY